MKKIIAVFLTLCMVGSIMLKNVNAEEKKIDYPFGYESDDIFVSDTLLGQSTDSNGNNLGFSNFAYNPVIKQYTYKTIAEGIIDREWLMGTSVFWKNAEDFLKGDFVDMATWKQVMYETLIMDWLTYQFESDEFKSEFQKDSAKYGWKITKYLLKKGDIYDENDLGKMSVESAANLLDNDFYEQNEILGNAEEFNKNASDIIKVVKTSVDYYKQFSKVLAAKSACKSRIEFLKKVKQVSSNDDLCKAIDVVIDKLNMSSTNLAFNEGGFTMLKTICSEAWDLLIKELKVPVLSEVKLGAAGFDWLFNLDNKADKNIELTILYIMNADFTVAYQQIRENYISKKTEDNAIVFNNSFLDYVLWEAYASNITKNYIAESLLEGSWNQIVNLFSKNNIQTYNDLKNMIDSDISVCNGWYNIVGKYYNTYNKILSDNEYMTWYNDNLVHVTGVHFERDEVEIGLEDNNAFFWENVIVTPENATNSSVTYKSSDESVISVKDKQTLDIEVHKTGTAIITVTTNDGGYTDTLKITVVEGHGKDGFYLEDSMPTGKLKVGDTFTVGLLTYKVTSDSKVEVDYCKESATSVNIPKYISHKGYSYEVTSIGDYAFINCNNLTSVTIPNSVTSIGDWAFERCSSLTSITIPNSVTSIGWYAFYGCSSLTSITIPNSVTSIGEGAFKYCRSLTSITIPDSITSIGDYAFSGCESLTSITIPDSVTSIGYWAFEGCSSLTSITIPNSVTSIGGYAFYECSSLKSITIPNSVTSIGGHAFYECSSLKSITIPDSVTNIENWAFEECSSLTSISIPNSVKTIGKGAFSRCSSLKSITIPNSVTSIGEGAFYDCSQLTLSVYADSYGLKYAQENNIPYKIISDSIQVTSIKLNKSTLSLTKGNSETLKATLTPSNATNKTLTWTSSNTKIATVDKNGKVTAVAPGTATITVKTSNGKTATCKVTVKSPITGVKLDTANKTVNKGNSFTLKATISPSDTTDSKTLTWTSSNTKIATVDKNGKVTAVASGTATITVKTSNGKTATCKVTVKNSNIAVTSIKLNKTNITVNKGKTYNLTATVAPSNATNKTIKWSTSNSKIVKVDSKGKVTAVSNGKATITAKSSNGKTAKCTVTVPYTITYKLNGGTNNKSNPSTYYGKKITLKNPTRKGYTFSGWYSDSKFKKKVTSFSSGNKTLYAKWSKVTVAKAKTPALTNVSGKKLKITYSATSGAKGYQIQYSTSKKFSNPTTKTLTGRSATYTLTKGKTYYVRVRAYKIDSTGAKVYGSWSAVKSKKITK